MIRQLSEHQPSTINHQTSNNPDQIKVAVLRGGVGREREVSLESGRCVAEAMQQAGLDVVLSDLRPDDLQILDRRDIDVFFPALHGEFGEDGQLQQVFEERGLVYTGSGPEASRLAFDKMASKRRFADAGVAVPAVVECTGDMGPAVLEDRLKGLGDGRVEGVSPSNRGRDARDMGLGERFVVKPIRQGSSVGVHLIAGRRQAVAAAQRVFEEFGDCMVEAFIPGREITVGVLGRQALPIIEIRSQAAFYDYHAKYVDDRTQYLFDTIEDQSLRTRIQLAALACFDALGCRDFARVDFILSDDGTPYALEVNTIPGFTTHSLLPKAAVRIGLSMGDLCVRIVRTALAQRRRK